MERNVVSQESTVNIAGYILPCYVLEDGRRLLSASGMQRSLKMVSESDKKSPSRIGRYLGNDFLKSFLYRDKPADHYDPIVCYRGNFKIHGYEATVLADICEAFLEARRQGKLSQKMSVIAEQCEILMQGFARVGIIALIDEATGVQYTREKLALAKILAAHVAE